MRACYIHLLSDIEKVEASFQYQNLCGTSYVKQCIFNRQFFYLECVCQLPSCVNSAQSVIKHAWLLLLILQTFATYRCVFPLRFCEQAGTPSLAELLKEHAAANLPLSGDDTPYQLLTVSRRRVWSDVKRAFTKPYTNLNLPIRVIFSGEEAADDGGPRREFFRLALGAAISDPSLFSGPPSSRYLVHNTSALLEKCFLLIGKLMAISLTQGGCGPACLCPWVYDYLTLGFDGVEVAIDDIPDITIQDKLKRVSV